MRHAADPTAIWHPPGGEDSRSRPQAAEQDPPDPGWPGCVRDGSPGWTGGDPDCRGRPAAAVL